MKKELKFVNSSYLRRRKKMLSGIAEPQMIIEHNFIREYAKSKQHIVEKDESPEPGNVINPRPTDIGGDSLHAIPENLKE